jgi:hypothetical protein
MLIVVVQNIEAALKVVAVEPGPFFSSTATFGSFFLLDSHLESSEIISRRGLSLRGPKTATCADAWF